MRRYELMLLFRPDLEDDKLQSAVEKVTRAIVNAGGALTKVSPWGKRRMAYEIQHFREASYFLLHFDIAPSAIRDIERGMLISEEILRHLVTVLVDHGTGAEDELAPAALSADDAAERAAAGGGGVADAEVALDEVLADEGAVDEELVDDADVPAAVTDEADIETGDEDEAEQAGTAVAGLTEPRGG
jgi:small subunit ribosomal protein S6